MTDTAAITGTPSTPDTGVTAPVVAAPSETPTAPLSPTPVAAETPVAPVVQAAPTDPAKPVDPPVEAPGPLFTLPDDFKLRDEGKAKFETVIKGKLKDGVVSLKPQEVVDLFIEQARDSYTAWQAQTLAQDKAWETESKARFTESQRASAETGVGFLSSFEPAFRELVKGFSNHPSFVNAMRVVGERLSEDSFEIEGGRPQPAKKSAAERLYGKSN